MNTLSLLLIIQHLNLVLWCYLLWKYWRLRTSFRSNILIANENLLLFCLLIDFPSIVFHPFRSFNPSTFLFTKIKCSTELSIYDKIVEIRIENRSNLIYFFATNSRTRKGKFSSSLIWKLFPSFLHIGCENLEEFPTGVQEVKILPSSKKSTVEAFKD
jgi:hypothetical protein